MNRLKARERNFENIALGQCYDWKNFFSVNLVGFFMITFFLSFCQSPLFAAASVLL